MPINCANIVVLLFFPSMYTLYKIIPAKDPKQCEGSKRTMYDNVDDDDDEEEEDEDEDDYAEDEVDDGKVEEGRKGPKSNSGCKLAGQERP